MGGRGAIIVLGVLLAGCQGVSSVRCPYGWYCPADMVCHPSVRCVTQTQVQECVGKPELASCEISGVPKGSMRCRHNACVQPHCGDGVRDANEECDLDALAGKSCADLGYAGGTLSCRSDCSGYEIGGCTAVVPKGTFVMGSPPGELCRDAEDEMQHEVTLTHDFEMTPVEVTQDQFGALMGFNPSFFSECGGECPVENVTWHDAAAYCNALSVQRGLKACYACEEQGTKIVCEEAEGYAGQAIYDCPGYRLATEAEWEYAYRAGSDTTFYSGPIADCTGSLDPNADRIGWYLANADNTTHPGGLKEPNARGLYDMSGNVAEWCHDQYQEDLGSGLASDPVGTSSVPLRVQRGGGWANSPRDLRAAERNHLDPLFRFMHLGFRPVRTR